MTPTTPYLCLADGTPHTSATFSVDKYIHDTIPEPEILDSVRGRRALTQYDPLLFALLYLPATVTGDDGTISFADSHLQMYRDARAWAIQRHHITVESRPRYAYLAPRESGKSTVLFKVLPLWALMFGHAKFVAAFADSGTQAAEHLEAIRAELRDNKLLHEDAPVLTGREKKLSAGGDSKFEYRTTQGIVKARGIDSAVLGMKEGDLRPDLIILDDVEKGESNYSVAQAMKRLKTLQDVIFPLKLNATVLIAGTTTMAGSVMDDLARAGQNADDTEEWITSEQITVRYAPAIITDDLGDQRSMWPTKWPLTWLLDEQKRNPRSFAKNFQNVPMQENGIYFTAESFRYENVQPVSFAILSVDPAVSAKSTSDYTGMAVVSYSRATDHFGVRHASQVRMNGRQLRARATMLLEKYPDITAVLVETNQGGDLWTDVDGVFYGLPRVKVIVVHQNESKELRAERASIEFGNRKVLFEEPVPELERQLIAFPNVAHDDLVDALTSAINEIRSRVKTDRKKRHGTGVVVRRTSYVG